MTIVQLEYLLAIYRHKSFSKAAEKCFVTQPTLSMQIQNLESELGSILLDRSKKPIQATDAGLKFIEQAEIILTEVARMKEIKLDLKNDISGELRMGIIPTISPYLLPLFVSGFIKNYANLNLKAEEMITQKILDALRNDDLDIGIVATPLNEKDIYEIPVYKELMLVYASPNSSIYAKQNIEFSDLDIAELWILNEGHCFRKQILQVCGAYKDQKMEHSFTFESGSIDTLIRMVDVRGGFTLVPELIIPYLRKEQLKNLRYFKDPMPAREVSIISRRNKLKVKQIEVLRSEILKGVKNHFKQNSSVDLIPVS